MYIGDMFSMSGGVAFDVGMKELLVSVLQF